MVGDLLAVVSGDVVNGELVGIDAAAGTELWRAYSAADGSQPHVVSAHAFTDGSRVCAPAAGSTPSTRSPATASWCSRAGRPATWPSPATTSWWPACSPLTAVPVGDVVAAT